jgi:hypothetical protein
MAMQWMKTWGLKTGAKAALASAACFSLGGCLILPGEFDSAMTVRQNGDFSFSYKSQIQLVGLANLLNNDWLGDSSKAEFKAICWDDSIEPAADSNDLKVEIDRDDVAGVGGPAFTFVPAKHWKTAELAGQNESAAEDAAKAAEEAAQAAADAAASTWGLQERECTTAEINEQKAEWDRQQADKKKRDEQGKKMAEMMLGGIDPENPETIKRFTREVERLAAWHKIEHLGNGVFVVDYSTSGRLPDDYAFPVIPRYALGEPMIHVTRWDNGRLRVEAPAFRSDPEMSFSALMGMGSMASGMLGKSSDKMPAEPIAIKGSFTLTTDAPILANNSEDGPQPAGAMQILRWDIGPAAYGAPMALLKMTG